MKPNFLVIGAAKSGTTWLQLCLEQHPEVFVPQIKEVHFFSYHKQFARGFDWYQSFFAKCEAQKAVGEISPSYLVNPAAPQRIYNFNPQMRIIAILRNPIQRAYSNYCMSLCSNLVSKNIERELSPEATTNKLVVHGMYFEYINRYIELFGRQNVKILIYEDLARDPKSFIQQVYSFLEVDPEFEPSNLYKRSNQKKALPKYAQTIYWLQSCQEWLKRNSVRGKAVANYLRRSGYFDVLHRLNRSDESFPQLSPEIGQNLARFYREDVNKTSHLLNRDLSFWLDPYLTTN